MATKQAKIHFLATRGALPVKSTYGKPKSPGSNAIIIQDYDETKDKYVYAMIDVGYWRTTTGFTAQEKEQILYDKTLITKYLKRHKITELEFVLITHYHVDHFRGLKYLLTPETNDPKVNIKKLILPMNADRIEAIKNKITDDEYNDCVKAHNAIIKWFNTYKETHPQSQVLYFGDISATAMGNKCNMGMGKFTFYNTNPLTDKYAVRPDEITNTYNWSVDKFSIVTKYEVDGKRILLPSDIYALSEKVMLARDIGDCDVVQMSHHGSVNGNSTEFLDFVLGNNSKSCSAIQLRSGGKSTKTTLKRYRNLNGSGKPLVRIYGVWQSFKNIWRDSDSVTPENIAGIVLEIRDGAIRYCTRRFTDTAYDQRTIPEDIAYNITDEEVEKSYPNDTK